MDAPETSACHERSSDVLLSFGGPDSRSGFVDCLYEAMLSARICVFKDDCEPSVGEEITSKLHQAIFDSRIAVVILSKRYLSSPWRLRELTMIMNRRRSDARYAVLPIFYDVNVVDLGRLGGDLDEAFGKHDEMKRGLGEGMFWPEALASVARIMGWESSGARHDRELVQMVVTKVLSELKMMWIQQLPLFIRSVYLFFSEKKKRESQCQVFLAFHGPDTRYNLAAYLYVSLVASGIGVFNYDDPSLIGKDFSNEISNAIDHCKISILILSPAYSSSPWCLHELALMVDRMRTKGQIIFSIFYKVNPSHVRDLSDCFGECLLQLKELVHESIYDRWKRALREVGSLSGWESEKVADGHEEVLVKQVVRRVSSVLNDPHTHDPPTLSTE